VTAAIAESETGMDYSLRLKGAARAFSGDVPRCGVARLDVDHGKWCECDLCSSALTEGG